MKPTFGERAAGDDIQMPADGYCFYHCFNHAKSGGKSPLTREYAMRLQKQVVISMRANGLSTQAARLLKLGSAGYPDEEEFA